MADSREWPEWRSGPVLTYEFYIEDERYSVPTLQLVTAQSHLEALQLALALLNDGPHHKGVEVCQGGFRLGGFGTSANSACCPPHPAFADDAQAATG
jgi:hypothetical protein